MIVVHKLLQCLALLHLINGFERSSSLDNIRKAAPVTRNPAQGTTRMLQGASNHAEIFVQVGNTIIGSEADSEIGTQDVCISADGNTIAIGSCKLYKTSSLGIIYCLFLIFLIFFKDSNGYIMVMNYNGTDWLQMGNRLIGENSDNFGISFDLSSDGSTIVIGTSKISYTTVSISHQDSLI